MGSLHSRRSTRSRNHLFVRSFTATEEMFSNKLYSLAAHTAKISLSKNVWSTLAHRGLRSTATLRATFNVQDEDDFMERVLKSTTPIVVDFHAQWCGPCKLLAPRLESIISAKGEKVDLAKVDIDNVSEVAMEFGVSAIPAVLAIKDGKVIDKFVGLQDEVRIEAFVNKLIGE